jgi:hypothetical protein
MEELEPEAEAAEDQIAALNKLAREEAGGLVDEDQGSEKSDAEKGPKGAEELPRIRLPGEGRRVTDFAREAGQAMRDHGVYRRDEQPVVVSRESGGISPLSAERFCTDIESVAVTYVKKVVRIDGDEMVVEKQKTITPTMAKVVLASEAFVEGLKPLIRVNMARQPVMRQDGRIDVLKQGYDDGTGILTVPNPVKLSERASIEALSDHDRDVARKASAAVLKHALREFPMVSSLDLAVQVAAIISFYGAMLMPTNASRLNFFYKANKHRSGKTLLIKMVISLVMGRTAIQPFPKNEDKLIELLNSVAIGGRSYLVLDDIKGFLSSEALNGFLTASWWTGRKFHRQELFEAQRQAICFLSGHEVTLSPDLAGRFLECRLHVEEADASRHEVKNPIDDEYLERPLVRSELLNAVNALIILWDLAGRPKGSTVRPGFETWCRIYGGITEFAGFGDPCARRADDEGSDPELDDMQALIRALVETFTAGEKLKEFTFAELIDQCIELKAFAWEIEGNYKKEDGERWFQPSKKTESKLGWKFGQKYGGTIFTLPDGRRARFGRQGKNRQRRYTLEMLA